VQLTSPAWCGKASVDWSLLRQKPHMIVSIRHPMITDILLLLVLILINGVFAMSEIAIVSSRRARLVQMVDSGSSGARHALTLASEPTGILVECAGRDHEHRHSERRHR
jgi:hypothetical protein